MTKKKLKTLQDKVIIKEIKAQEISDGGIVLIKDISKHLRAEVITATKGYYKNNQFVEISVKVGDIVFLHPNAGTKIQHENEEFIVVREEEILAIEK